MNGFLLSLFDRKTLAEGSGAAPSGSGFRSLTLSYNVPEQTGVDALFKQLSSIGVRILKQPSATPFGGYYFTFADPENNVLEVAYNP